MLSNLVGRTLCCSMWVCVAASDFGAVGCSRSFDAVWCSVLQCVAASSHGAVEYGRAYVLVCCSVLQCVAMCSTVLRQAAKGPKYPRLHT